MRPDEAFAREDELSGWEEAREYYQSGCFAECADILAGLRNRFPERALYAVYAERVRKLRENAPPNWDGVWDLTAK